MNQNMIIDGDPKNNRLLVRCPLWANDLVRSLPSRRWMAGAKAWGVPMIRQNVEAVRGLVALGGVTTTDAAMRMIRGYDKQVADMGARGVGFPHWYKFKTEPRKHQRAALDKGYGLKAYALFMDMQTGKSKTTIDLIAAHRMEGHIHGALILPKLTLRNNWVKQFKLHCPIPYSIYLPDTSKQREFDHWLARPHDFKVMVAGWESLSAGRMNEMCERFLMSMIKAAVAGDETSYITSHKAARSLEAVRLAQMADYRYALTGTPASEGPMNLFMQFEFLDPNIIGIGDFYAFRNRYAVMGGYTPKEGKMRGKPLEIVGYQNLDELMELIGPHTFQVLKTDAYDLPPKRYEERTVQLSKAQRAIYDKIRKEKVIGTGDTAVQNALELALRLHQVAGGYGVSPREEIRVKKDGTRVPKIFYDPVELIAPAENPKMVEVVSIVEEFKHKKQGIIWAVYMPELLALIKLMKHMGMKVGELHGGIKEHARQPMVDAFQDGGLDLMVCNASTGGMGYTMMASEVNIFYNNTFKMIDRLQAEDRAYGDGQTKSGIWIDVLAERTVDLTVMRALEVKEDMATYLKKRIKDVTRLLDGDD